jgi:alkylglycerol monooxygenase
LPFRFFYLFHLLGFDPVTFGAAAAVQTLYQFWIHTRVVDKMHPWIEYWLNTPSHHRVHHAINPKFLDKNHAGMFMIWDRMFGTFQAESETTEIQYGITTPLSSWNPAWANFHFYVELFNKMTDTKGILHKVSLFFRKPGYEPQLQEVAKVPEINKLRLKYDVKGNTLFQVYCFVQFSILTLGAIAYLGYFKELTLLYKLIFAAIIFFSIEMIGGLFEQKTWAKYGELLRLVIIAVVLNIFYYQFYPIWLQSMLFSSFLAVGIFYTVYVLLMLPSTTSKLKV